MFRYIGIISYKLSAYWNTRKQQTFIIRLKCVLIVLSRENLKMVISEVFGKQTSQLASEFPTKKPKFYGSNLLIKNKQKM